LSYEALHPPLRQTAVTSWRSVVRVCKPLTLLSLTVIVCVVLVSAVAYFLFSEGEEIFLIQFCLRGKGGSSFASFALCLGLCGLQMCLHLCVGCSKRYFLC